MYLTYVFVLLTSTALYSYRWTLFHAILSFYRWLYPDPVNPANNTIVNITLYEPDREIKLDTLPLSIPDDSFLVVDYWYSDKIYKYVFVGDEMIEFPMYENLEPFEMKCAVVAATIDDLPCSDLINALAGPLGDLSKVTTEHVRRLQGGERLVVMGYDFKERVYELSETQAISK